MPGAEELINEGRQLFAIWQAGQEPGFLDAAVKVFEQALALPWKTPKEQASCQAYLLQALSARVALRSDLADTDRLIAALSALIRVGDEPFLYRNRGRSLMTRYTRTSSSADLDAAIADFGHAFEELGRRGDGEIHQLGLDLSWARETRFDLRQGRGEDFQVYWDAGNGVELLNGPQDLVTPIYLLEGLLAQDGRPNVPRTGPPPRELAWREKRNLANLLLKYAAATARSRSPQDRARDSARAVELLRQAWDEVPADSGEYASVISSLIAALKASPQPDPALVDRLATALEESLATITQPSLAASTKLNLASLLTDQGRIDEAVALYRELCSASHRGAHGPAPSAAPVSLRTAEMWALSALERSAWPEVVEAHACATALTAALRASQPDWQARYLWSGASGRVAILAAFALTRLGLPAEAADALQEGRTLMLTERLSPVPEPGARRPVGPAAGLIRDPADPAVFLFATPVGSAALFRADGEWGTIPLPGLSYGLLVERAERYVTALDAYHLHPGMTEEAWKAELDRTLGFLRDGLRPLSGALPPGDVTMVPVGLFAALPVGAALLDGIPAGGVSIVPALSLRPAVAPAMPDRALVIADPSLPWAEWEGVAVSAFFPSSAPRPGDASAEAMLAVLPPHGVVHFACHATADLGSPLQSRLELPGGGRLTVADILEGKLPPLALVVLSACETGLPDSYFLDECIGFPAAFIAAANASVVSTLWKVNDLSTSLLILRFYWEWRQEKAPPALALARAQWWQRSTAASDKCAFLEQAVAAGVLIAPAAEAMTAQIRRLSPAAADNPFAHPHHWAAFTYAG